ncbi:MAG: hypothetical protein ACW99J_19420, partial [Candidatus Thorarchaeota archaeon]
MPTGRPDYWYGTALYFEESPADGEITRGPTSNWAYDHNANEDAHHTNPSNLKNLEIGDGSPSDTIVRTRLYSADNVNPTLILERGAGWDAAGLIDQKGTGDFSFKLDGNTRFKIKTGGGVEEIWDDTPTDGQVTKGVTSDWAYDHVNAADAHHAKYTDAEAVTAVEAIVDDTPVDGATDQPVSSNWAFDHKADAAAHHAKYLDAEAVSAMGAKADANALNHDRFEVENYTAFELGASRGSSGNLVVDFHAETSGDYDFRMMRIAGVNSNMMFYQAGTGSIVFQIGGVNKLRIFAAGGLGDVWDDTPTNGEVTKGVTSDWAFDHKADAAAHHAR